MEIFRQDKIELNKSDYRLIGAYLIIMWLWLGYRFAIENYGLVEAVLDIFLNTVKTLAGFFILRFLLEYFILQRKQWLIGLICIVIAFILIGSIINILGNLTAGLHPLDFIYPFHEFLIRGFNTTLFEVALVIGIVFSKKSYDQLINNRNLAIENRENALKILRAQFSPHFLFNNLNTIDALIDEQPALAKKYVSHLASLYRYLTETVNQDVMPLAEELNFLQDYLFLLEVRYGDDYSFTIQQQQAIENRFLPAGALQTALENVVKHNAVVSAPILTTILIKAESVSISNKRGGRSAANSPGTGLQNLQSRYELLGAPPVVIVETSTDFTLQLPLLLAQP